MSTKPRYLQLPTSRESRCFAGKKIKKLGISRPARWLALAFAWYHCEAHLNGKQITLSIILNFVKGFLDLCLFFRAYYGNRQKAYHPPKTIHKTIAQVVRKLREWRSFTVVFNSKVVEIPLYSEVVDIELAKHMDIAINHSPTTTIINLEFMIATLHQVSAVR